MNALARLELAEDLLDLAESWEGAARELRANDSDPVSTAEARVFSENAALLRSMLRNHRKRSGWRNQQQR